MPPPLPNPVAAEAAADDDMAEGQHYEILEAAFEQAGRDLEEARASKGLLQSQLEAETAERVAPRPASRRGRATISFRRAGRSKASR